MKSPNLFTTLLPTVMQDLANSALDGRRATFQTTHLPSLPGSPVLAQLPNCYSDHRK